MDQNPYAPTKAALGERNPDEPVDADALDIASRGRRLANLLVDMVGNTLLVFVLAIIFTLIGRAFYVDILGSLGPLFGLGTSFLYYVVGEALFGRTLGKLVTRTRVVAESGAPAKPRQVILRTLYRFVPFDALSFLGKRRPGWHDRWSKTRVIMSRQG